MKEKIIKMLLIGTIICGYKILYAPGELKKSEKEGQIQWVEGQRGWDENGTYLWTGVSPLPNYNVGIGTTVPTNKLQVEGGSDTAIYARSNATVVGYFKNTRTSGYPLYAVYGECANIDWLGCGGYFKGGALGVVGIVQPTGNGVYKGVCGEVYGGSGVNYGVWAVAQGNGRNYAVYGSASGGNENWGGYFYGNGYFSGNVGIGIDPLKLSDYLHVQNSISVVGPGGGLEGGQINLANPTQQYGGQTNAWSIDNYNNDLRIFYNSGAIRLFIDDATGNVGIGTTTPSHKLQVGNQGDGTSAIANAWNTFSSKRWKENIRTIENALDKVKKLRGVYFEWRGSKKKDIGMIAEEVGEIIPEVVEYEENGKDAKSIDYAKLVSLLVEAIKEQQRQIEELKKKLEKRD